MCKIGVWVNVLSDEEEPTMTDYENASMTEGSLDLNGSTMDSKKFLGKF
jgi:hypothetical protein